jgi:D-arabinono-1,4-lactone oxidase
MSALQDYLTTNPRLATELQRTDPAVPFRARTSHSHHTWARTFYSRPDLYIQPQSLEEIQKVVTLARRCRRRLVVVGSGHSPSTLTCTSSWMINLDNYGAVLGVDRKKNSIKVQAGIRLHSMNDKAAEYGLTIPNLGSIDEQSIAGAIATGTHGSSLRHGILASNVLSMRIVLANGSCVRCSPAQNPDLFRAALVSLGALGIVVEVEYQLVEDRRIEWTQTSVSLDDLLANWNGDLWTSHEFVRVWWMPYTRRAIVWKADATKQEERPPKTHWYAKLVGYRTHKAMLWVSHYFPALLPAVEWFVFGMQYGFKNRPISSAVESQSKGLLMDCLYSQFVNEWALPLENGPAAIRRLDAWMNDTPFPANDGDSLPITHSKKNGIYVHAPIEVRVSDTSSPKINPRPRGLLDMSSKTGPTLYLNATLYRPGGLDPPCVAPYYQVFETCMREANGRPHWAKNFSADVTVSDIEAWYGEDLKLWRRQRHMVDPEGLFVGPWHRDVVLGTSNGLEKDPVFVPGLPYEERLLKTRKIPSAKGGGSQWIGVCTGHIKYKDTATDDGNVDESRWRRSATGSSSEESFDHFASAEAEASVWIEDDRAEDDDDDDEETE